MQYEEFNALYSSIYKETSELKRENPGFYPYQVVIKKIDDMKAFLEYGAEISRDDLPRFNLGIMTVKLFDNMEGHHEYASALYKFSYGFFSLLQAIPLIYDPNNSKHKAAHEFYENHGYKKEKIFFHLEGIDFNKSVDDNHKIIAGHTVQQWQIANSPIGSYFSELTSKPEDLGINPKGLEKSTNKIVQKIAYKYKVSSSITVLRTTAAEIIDDWSVKNCNYLAKGGAIQYMNRLDQQYFIASP